MKAALDKQLMVTVSNKVGSLAEVSHVIAQSGINLLAICAYGVDNKGVIMFVSDNTESAKRSLKSKKYDVREEEVILISLDNKPGALQQITQKVANAGIDLNLLYGSVDNQGKTSRVVLTSENNNAVLTVLNMK